MKRPMSTKCDDRARVHDPSKRSEAWFDAMFRLNVAAVTAYVRRRSPGEPDDVTAEVFCLAWRERHRVPDEPLPWLYRAAGNLLMHEQRSFSRRARLTKRVQTLADRGSSGAVPTDPDHEPLLVALQGLRAADQEILRLSAWEELDIDEIAATLECSVPAARVRLHRARSRLRVRLQVFDKAGSARAPSSASTPTPATLEVTA